MLWLRTRHFDTVEMPVASAVTAIEEGSSLVQITEGGIGKVTNNSASNNDRFVGVAFSQMNTFTSFTAVEEGLIIPSASPYSITLQRTPVSATGGAVTTTSLRVVSTAGETINANPSSVASTTNGATGVVNLTGSTLYFSASDVGSVVNVYYFYAPTVAEVNMWVGDGVPGSTPTAFLQTIGVIRRGEIYTSMYDAGTDWSAASLGGGTAIKCNANGMFAVGGTGATVTGYVTHVPSTDIPFLSLFISG